MHLVVRLEREGILRELFFDFRLFGLEGPGDGILAGLGLRDSDGWMSALKLIRRIEFFSYAKFFKLMNYE